jgi:hypothetical protein
MELFAGITELLPLWPRLSTQTSNCAFNGCLSGHWTVITVLSKDREKMFHRSNAFLNARKTPGFW